MSFVGKANGNLLSCAEVRRRSHCEHEGHETLSRRSRTRARRLPGVEQIVAETNHNSSEDVDDGHCQLAHET